MLQQAILDNKMSYGLLRTVQTELIGPSTWSRQQDVAEMLLGMLTQDNESMKNLSELLKYTTQYTL